jgi:O-antigen/teichoic acid export membrane protein
LLKRLAKSFGALAAGQTLTAIGQILLVPVFLSHWSTGTFGEWMALSAVVAYLNATDLGMNAAAGNKMLAVYAKNDLGTYRVVQNSAIAFYVILAAVGTGILGLVCALCPVSSWLGIKSIPASTAAAVAWILAARTLWQMPLAQVASVYRSTGNMATTQWISNAQAVSLIVVTGGVVLTGGGVLSVAAWGTLPVGVVGGCAWLSLVRWRKNLAPNLRYARASEFCTLLKPSLWFGIMILAIALSVQGPVVLTSALLGGSAVALLVTTRTLAFLLRQALGMATAALWPELTRLEATGAGPALRRAHRLLSAGSVALCCAFGGALWWEGAEVIRVWTMGKLAGNDALLDLFLVSLVLQAPWVASAAFTTATNRHKTLAQCWIASSVVTLGTCAFLLPYVGVAAVPISTIIGEGIACYHFVIKDACVVINEDYRRFALRLWPSLILIWVVGLAAGRLGHAVAVGPAPLRWLEVGTITTIAVAATAWAVAIKGSDRWALAARYRAQLPFLRRLLGKCYQAGC